MSILPDPSTSTPPVPPGVPHLIHHTAATAPDAIGRGGSPDAGPTKTSIVLVNECRNSEWVANPRRDTVYILNCGDPAEIGRRVSLALAALHRCQRRRGLTLIPGGAR